MWRPWRVRRRLTSTAAPAAAGGGVGQDDGPRHHHAAGAGEEVESDGKRHGNRHQRQDKLSRRKSSFLGIRKRDTVWFGLATFFLFPVLLVLVDVMKDRRISGDLQWHKHYMRAVVDSELNWGLGWRLEDLARQAASQRARMTVLLETLHELPSQRQDGGGGGGGGGSGPFSISQAAKAAAAALTGGDGKQGSGGLGGGGDREAEGEVSRAVELSRVLAEEEDLTRIVSIQCAARPGVYVQVGMHAMVASAEASCKVYSAAAVLDPHALFEKIELGEGRFALRTFSSTRFLRVTPPPPGEGDWTVWALEADAPEVGLPEMFQMRDGMVYSEVMHGYLTCSGSGAEAEVKGFVGEYLWQDEANYQLVFKEVPNLVVENARILRDISRAVNKEQRREADAYIASQAALGRRSEAGAPAGEKAETIAVCIPMTSRGTVMNTTYDSPVWTHAFSTFLSGTDWRAPKFRFHWYFGFDAGDKIYDGPKAAKHLGKEFVASAVEEFARQGLHKMEARRLLEDKVLLLKTKSYSGMQHAPSYVVSALMQDAYDDGCDYFYQINDDTLINTIGWAEIFTRELRTNPLGRNVGVTGPADTNNRRILTHAFVHRTHIDVFGRFFPASFRNWWSDDWISNVYGREHTLRDHSVTITHDVRSQKSAENNRYQIDYSAQHGLRDELQRGYVTLSKWLIANDMPPPLLPLVCGYAPLTSNILKALQGGWGQEKPPAPIPPAMVAGGNEERAGATGPALEDEAAVEPAAASERSNSKVVFADAARAARNSEIRDDAGSPAR